MNCIKSSAWGRAHYAVKKSAKRRERWKLIQEKREKRKPHVRKRKARNSRNPVVSQRASKGSAKANGRRRVRSFGSAKLKIPKVFSFIENPLDTLRTIEKLQAITAQKSVKEIEIDHSGCEVLDLCASVVMDVTLLQAQAHRKGNQLGLKGTYSEDVEVNVMLRGSGILKQLAHPHSILPESVEKTVRTCDLFHGKASRIERSRQCDEAATKLTDYFDRCLKMQGFALSRDGKFRLSSLITEVIGNAEEHGGRWYTIGYFHQTKDRGGHCHVVLFNFGRTISESILEHAASQELTARIESLLATHRNRGFLRGMLNPKWEKDALVTVFALQEGVSRLSFTKRGVDRGNGTVSMIDFFNQLAGGSQKMCLISGKTYILFDGKFNPQKKRVGNHEERRVIAFNKENDLEKPPDKDYVWTMDQAFPGTLISIRFDLDRSNLEKLAKA